MPASSSDPEVVGQVRRGLDVDVGRQHQRGQRDGVEVLVRGQARRLVHRGARLGQEVLDDHLLHVTVTAWAAAMASSAASRSSRSRRSPPGSRW
jgi:hypothetical protein